MRIFLHVATIVLSFASFGIMTVPTFPGVQIEVLQEGSGAREVKRGDTISVHYTGTLVGGKKFDSSLDRGDPLTFPVGKKNVITGWDEGLIGMKIGEKRKLTIEPQHAYGDSGIGGVIPPKATLIFDTELVSIKGVKKDEL